MNDVHPLMPSW